jgi:hypothetical protein
MEGALAGPPQRITQLSHHADCPARSVYAASATGSLYRSPLAIMAQTSRDLVGECDGGDLGRPPCQSTLLRLALRANVVRLS